MMRRARWFGLTAAALSGGVAQAQVVPFTGQVIQDFVNAVTEGVDRAIDPNGRDLALPATLANRSSGYDIDEVRVSYDRELDILYVGIRAFGVAGDVDGDGRPGETSPELRALGGIDAPHFGPPESFAFMIDFDEDGIYDLIAGVPFLGAIDPNDLERNGPRPGDADGFQVSAFVGGVNAALAPGAAFGAPVDTGWRLHASPNSRQPDLEFEIRGFSVLAAEYQSGLNGPDLSNFFAVDAYMGSAGDVVGEDFLHGGFLQDPPDGNPPPVLCPRELQNVEFCNDFDDDCDRELDEGPLYRMVDGQPVPFDELSCDTDLPGVCRVGQPDCRGGQEICIPTVRPGVQDEICDGLDNDCDGQVDEDTVREPLPGIGVMCDTELPGLCMAGTAQCREGALVCVPDGDPMPELCNGSDDNCNGEIDEAFPTLGMACQNGVGACARDGVFVCAPDQQDVACNAPEPGDPVAELCNGGDDDCDGTTDEAFPGVGLACTVGVRACAVEGVTVCTADGMETTCGARPLPECCGNGVAEAGEECDDGNDVADDGCTNACRSCGNGVCDDGETVESCREDCEVPLCGNEVVDAGEDCDDGDDDDTDGCNTECRSCGNGTCDKGETAANCPADCSGTCGDNKADPGEECDDGNQDSTDGCTSACELCGNGICGASENSNICPEDCAVDAGPRLTGADLSDNCSMTRPHGGSAWWLVLLGLPLLRRRRRA
ncbi:MAG: hypothetical protein KC549_07815 [Myxococcales bacterium]|nr:hypothetical protein [Myxococcales bacterium]